MSIGNVLITVGHSTHTMEDFSRLLGDAGVHGLVDIRIGPGSKRNPQFQRTAMTDWMPASGVAYRWERRLGGFRKSPDDSPDVALRNESFRGYAAHMRTAQFHDALHELLTRAIDQRTTVMCSEAVWWRCHRRLVADAATLLHGWQVQHLMPDGRLTPHRLTDGVRTAGNELVYDAGLLTPD